MGMRSDSLNGWTEWSMAMYHGVIVLTTRIGDYWFCLVCWKDGQRISQVACLAFLGEVDSVNQIHGTVETGNSLDAISRDFPLPSPGTDQVRHH